MIVAGDSARVLLCQSSRRIKSARLQMIDVVAWRQAFFVGWLQKEVLTERFHWIALALHPRSLFQNLGRRRDRMKFKRSANFPVAVACVLVLVVVLVACAPAVVPTAAPTQAPKATEASKVTTAPAAPAAG